MKVRKVRISAKHQTALTGKKGAVGAIPYRVAPISTCPTLAVETDLLGDEILPMVRKNGRPEAAALAWVLRIEEPQPAVAWGEYVNSGE